MESNTPLPWFLVSMDLSLANLNLDAPADTVIQVLGTPTLSGLYGPFESWEATAQYQSTIEEPGTHFEITQCTDPETFPPAE
jgi:hypothetical protein